MPALKLFQDGPPDLQESNGEGITAVRRIVPAPQRDGPEANERRPDEGTAQQDLGPEAPTPDFFLNIGDQNTRKLLWQSTRSGPIIAKRMQLDTCKIRVTRTERARPTCKYAQEQ